MLTCILCHNAIPAILPPSHPHSGLSGASWRRQVVYGNYLYYCQLILLRGTISVFVESKLKSFFILLLTLIIVL